MPSGATLLTHQRLPVGHLSASVLPRLFRLSRVLLLQWQSKMSHTQDLDDKRDLQHLEEDLPEGHVSDKELEARRAANVDEGKVKLTYVFCSLVVLRYS